jgi:hypothetical protein
MRADKAFERRQQFFGATPVAAQNRPTHAIGDHGANLAAAFGLPEQALCQGRRVNVCHPLMFGDGANLMLGQTAQRNAVFKGNHGAFLQGNARPCPGRDLPNLERTPVAVYVLAVHCSIN